MAEVSPDKSPKSASDLSAPAPRTMIPCPKCGTQVRDVATFCTRCHATLRFHCPSCAYEQRHGGTCEKCGVDFVKYLGAVVAVQKGESDLVRDRLDRRSSLLKNILLVPFTLGIPLIRSLFIHRDRGK